VPPDHGKELAARLHCRRNRSPPYAFSLTTNLSLSARQRHMTQSILSQVDITPKHSGQPQAFYLFNVGWDRLFTTAMRMRTVLYSSGNGTVSRLTQVRNYNTQ